MESAVLRKQNVITSMLLGITALQNTIQKGETALCFFLIANLNANLTFYGYTVWLTCNVFSSSSESQLNIFLHSYSLIIL